ncbi:MAG: ParB/RepB/Spo0J family partition protein [Chloroflexota bacterium]|nr:ParB/RepB/Spo0J family partition protein [Chloroflexota bacterium]
MSSRKIGLGKGLESLIPTAEEEGGEARQGVFEVPLDSVSPNPHQPRSPIREEDLRELAASIEEHGIIQPLVVTETVDGYQLIAGERRWRAARVAGLSKVPILVKDVASSEVLELALVENLQRSDLNPLEEAMAFQQLVEEFGLTQKQIARRVGKSRTAVANKLRLLTAARQVQEALLEERISEGHARALLGLEGAAAQEAGLETVLKRELSVRQTEQLVRRLLGRQEEEQRSTQRPSPGVRELETQFRQALSTKVSLRRKGKGGQLVIYFYSEEELAALYEHIVGD